jgi:BirA family transcriptional regulator, biotin operon repressor / biotin---[acetyl-CoA-carboxylase] ligase
LPHPPVQPPLGLPFIELQSIDSTNNYALERIHAGLAQHGAAFFAHEQVAGKGQRGKTWIAERGSNLILSIVIQPRAIVLSQQFQLNACIAVSVCEFFKKYAGKENTRIKWPNDLYWQDRKAGGVLIENLIGQSATGNWQWAVAGIGININQVSFPPELKNAVSLAQITGKKFNTAELARELCEVLESNYKLLCNNGFDRIYELYLDQLYKKGQTVRFKKNNRIFEALVKTVSSYGTLIVQHAMEEEFTSGEIEWRI